MMPVYQRWLLPPVARELTASISSMNRMHGACFLASLKSSAMAASTSPKWPSLLRCHSAYEVATRGTLQVAASAVAKMVLPVPGSPCSRAPLSTSDQGMRLCM